MLIYLIFNRYLYKSEMQTMSKEKFIGMTKLEEMCVKDKYSFIL